MEHPIAPQSTISKKVAFFQKNQLGIGQSWLKLEEIGQKMDFRALFSEIYMKIEYFSSLELKSACAPIAQLAERLTFFIWFRPDQTWPEWAWARIQVEEHDFFFFAQIHYFMLFMHESMTYIDKQESKVLGGLLLITLNFWTVCTERFFLNSCHGVLNLTSNFMQWIKRINFVWIPR